MGHRNRIVGNVNVDLRDLIDFIVVETNRHQIDWVRFGLREVPSIIVDKSRSKAYFLRIERRDDF